MLEKFEQKKKHILYSIIQIMSDLGLSDRTSSTKSKTSKTAELTPEQIQQQNILRLNGFRTSTILRNVSNDDSYGEEGNSGTDGMDGRIDDILNTQDEDSMDPMHRFGLIALDSLLKQEDNDQNNIAKGIDLNMLGLDLSLDKHSHILSKTFASPWLETSRSEVEPLFTRPESFNINANEIVPVTERMPSFNDLTLFFLFYTKPRDILQELAARELNKRNWRYHKELQVWLTKDTNSEPKSIGSGAEQGTYIFFDPVTWEFVTKTMVLYYNSIM